ncbi:MAG: DUF349 domain-containing protein [Flavobacteriaceae bacterium]|jgi:hypothetical protein|nr:DUF349 domain-containing protein [Flavobacteriaceae bacterium]
MNTELDNLHTNDAEGNENKELNKQTELSENEVNETISDSQENSPDEKVNSELKNQAEITENQAAEAVSEVQENSPVEELETKTEIPEETSDSKPAEAVSESQENSPVEELETKTEIPEEKTSDNKPAEAVSESQENSPVEELETKTEIPEETSDSKPAETVSEPQENAPINELDSEKTDSKNNEMIIPEKNYQSLGLEELINEVRELQNKYPVQSTSIQINAVREAFLRNFENFNAKRKEDYLAGGGDELSYQEDFSLKNKFNSAYHDYKTKLADYHKEQGTQEQKNLETRLQIIEELKDLYNNPIESIGVFFKKFSEIKKRWYEAGKIPKAKAGDVFRTYYHHLDNTYEFIKLNKELQELDFAHNLEHRRSIIKRAEELVSEPSVQKALNELQYLHKMWKEQGEPVAEEFKESTWQEFKEVTQKIHERKTELMDKIKAEQQTNLEKKQTIIAELEKIGEEASSEHSFWLSHIKKIEKLREDFLAAGRTPKEFNSDLWAKFKAVLHTINHKKNTFYKELKHDQQTNFQKKNELLEIAKANKDSEDWSTALNLYKKIQNDWKKTGHVPKKYADALWKEFRENCNYFFERYKQRNDQTDEEWQGNLEKKKAILEEIKNLSAETREEALKKINEFNIQWNAVGKVPRESMNINRSFNQAVKEIIKKFEIEKSQMDELQINLKIENYKHFSNDRKLDEDLRRMKKQMQDLEHETVQLENNLAFFSNAKSDNPLLKNVHNELKVKKGKLEELKHTYSKLINLDLSSEENKK